MNDPHTLSSEDIEYVLNLPFHLTLSNMPDELFILLTDFDFLQHKVSVLGPQPLIEDFDSASHPAIHTYLQKNPDLEDDLTLLQEALRLSAHVLTVDREQLAGQLLGRLLKFNSLIIIQLIQQAKTQSKTFQIYPITSSLTSPKSYLFRTLNGHTGSVTAIAITSDGQRIISASEDNTLKVWDLPSGLEILTLNADMLLVQDVALTPDGRYAISAAGNIENRNSNLRVWDLKLGVEKRKLIGHTTEVTSIAITPDGNRVVSASADIWKVRNLIKVWDLLNGNELQTLAQDIEPFSAIAITPDGKFVIVGLFNGTLKILNLEDGSKIYECNSHTSAVKKIIISPDGKLAVSASSDTTIKVWDLHKECELFTFIGHKNRVDAADITPDGNSVISAAGNIFKVWDLHRGFEIQSFLGHRGINDIAISPNGKFIASAGNDQTVRIWRLQDRALMEDSNKHDDYIHAIAMSPNGKVAVSASSDKTLKVWDVNNGRELRSLTGHSAAVRSVVFTPNGRFIVSASEDRTLKIWNWYKSEAIITLIGHTSEINSIAITPDGKHIISVSSDQTLRKWELQSGLELESIALHEIATKTVVTPNGKSAILASQDGILSIWDFYNNKLSTIPNYSIGPQGAFAITPDGKSIISAQEDCSLTIRAFQDGSEIQTLTGHTCWVVDIAIIQNCNLCISVSEDHENTLKVWNLLDGINLVNFTSDSGLRCCAVTPNGRKILAGGVLGQLHFLELANSEKTLSPENTYHNIN